MSTMGLPVPVDLRHCTILPGIAPTYVLRCPAHIVLPLVRLLHCIAKHKGGASRGGGGQSRYVTLKRAGECPLGDQEGLW